MSKLRLILNRIKTPDGTVLTSYHIHDFVMHKDANGNEYGVDGGTSYCRRIGNTNECEDLSVWIDEDNFDEEFEKIREYTTWGTRGKNGDEPLRWVKLKEMTDQHLEAMLIYEGPVSPFIKKSMEYEAAYRKKFGILLDEKLSKTKDEIEAEINRVMQKYLWEINSPENRNKIALDVSNAIDEKVTDATTNDEIDNGTVSFIDSKGKKYTISFVF